MPSDQTTQPDIRLLILPVPDFALLPFGAFLDKLRFSADDEDFSRQRYCRWHLLGLNKGSVTSSSGVDVAIQMTPEQIHWTDVDYLVVFGGRSAEKTRLLASEYAGLLHEAVRHDIALVSIDNACFLLAELGLLNGSKIALHWRHVQEFQVLYPRVETKSEQLYLFDGKRISCAGGSATIDLAIELLAYHCGRTRALKGLADMLVDEQRSSLHSLKSLSVEPQTGRHLGRAISLMRQQLSSNQTVDDIADRIGISRRQLDRLFLQRFAQTARVYWQEMRMQHLRWRLVNSDHRLAALADEVGAQDASHLNRMFRQRFGMSAGEYRKQAKAVASR